MFLVRLSLLLSILLLNPSHAHTTEPLVFRGKSLEQWRADLHSVHPHFRARAAAALGLGPFGKAAVPFLLESIKDEEYEVKQSALFSLAELGPTSDEAAPALIAEIQLRPDRWGWRYGSYRRSIDVSRITPASIPLVLTRAREDPYLAEDAGYRHSYLNEVNRSAVPMLRKVLRDGYWPNRAAAASALEKLGNDAAEAIPELLAALRDEEPRVCRAALDALGSIHSPQTIVPRLAPLLHGDQVYFAACALRRQGMQGMAVLRQAYYGGSNRERLFILHSLNEPGTDALPLLLHGLTHRERNLHFIAARNFESTTVALDREVPQLIAALDHEVPRVRQSMVAALQRIVPPRREVVQALANRLTDDNHEVRAGAAKALRSLRRYARPTLPAVYDLLKHDSSHCRCLAVDLLEDIAPPENKLILALSEAVRDSNQAVRERAMSALAKIGPPVRKLVKFEGPQDHERRTEIVVPILLACLRDPESSIRITAASTLLKIGYQSDTIVRQLGQEVLDPWRRVLRLEGRDRARAASILEELGPKAVPALPELMLALYDGEIAAIEVVGAMGAAGQRALPALERMLNSSCSSETHRRIATAMIRIGGDGPGVVRAALAQSNEQPRLPLLHGVKEAGHAAKGFRPDVMRLTQDPDPQMRCVAIQTLGAIGAGGEDVRGVLERALRDESDLVRSAACQALLAMGVAGRAAIPTLIEALVDRSEGSRQMAVEGLGRIDPGDRDALPALIETLTDPEVTVRKAAVEALAGAGRPALNALRGACRDRNETVRVAAACALSRIEGNSDQAGRVLRSIMVDGKDGQARVQACTALWKKESTREVVPLLASLLREDGWMVREAAVEALSTLDGAGDDVRAFMKPLLRHELRAVRAAAWRVLEKTSPELTPFLVDAR
jgi:HEAT repeat protein